MTSVRIYSSNKQKKVPVTPAFRGALRRAIKAALRTEGITQSVEISLTFTDSEGIRALNREYRGRDSATDVLSFPQYDFAAGEAVPPDEPLVLGDIVLSLEYAQKQADELGHSLTREAQFLCVHSVLHLLGYDHERSNEAEEEMFSRQRTIMAQLNEEGGKANG